MQLTAVIRSFVLCVFALGFIAPVRGEQFITRDEARRLTFPNADRVQSGQLLLSADDVSKIQKATDTKKVQKTNDYMVCFQGTNWIGTIVFDRVIGKHEWIDYSVALAPDAKILNVEILVYREHYGGAVREAKWRQQFKGKGPESRMKFNQDIFNVTGATMSCRSVTEGVRRVLAVYDLLLRPRLPGGVSNQQGNGR